MGILTQIFRKSTQFFRARKKHPECAKNPPVMFKIKIYKPGIELLEDRTMLSASSALLDNVLAPRTGALGDTAAIAVVDSVPLSSFAAFVHGQPAPSQVVIVDGAVPNYQELINGIGGSGLAASASVAAVLQP